MRVMLLGAGASIGAGYPSTKDLLPAVEEFSRKTRMVGVQDEWQKWMAFRDSETSEVLRSLLNTTNPEIALSALDLLSLAHDDHMRTKFNAALSFIKNNEPDHYKQISAKLDPFISNAQMSKASSARHGLLHCINLFFIEKSYEETEYNVKRSYLSDLFSVLHDGDVVITLNWDSAAERTLGEMGLWNPATGYGLAKSLSCCMQNAYKTSPQNPLPRSDITVLKLHGSVGWMRRWNSDDGIFFDNFNFLNHLRVQLPGKQSPITFFDPGFDQISHDEPAIVVPTFLKSVPAGAEMQNIWNLGGLSLLKADSVDVWGYSLPASDSAVRVLLNALRFRTQRNEVRLLVRDPCEETRKRWDQFIGVSVSRDERLG